MRGLKGHHHFMVDFLCSYIEVIEVNIHNWCHNNPGLLSVCLSVCLLHTLFPETVIPINMIQAYGRTIVNCEPPHIR